MRARRAGPGRSSPRRQRRRLQRAARLPGVSGPSVARRWARHDQRPSMSASIRSNARAAKRGEAQIETTARGLGNDAAGRVLGDDGVGAENLGCSCRQPLAHPRVTRLVAKPVDRVGRAGVAIARRQFAARRGRRSMRTSRARAFGGCAIKASAAPAARALSMMRCASLSARSSTSRASALASAMIVPPRRRPGAATRRAAVQAHRARAPCPA